MLLLSFLACEQGTAEYEMRGAQRKLREALSDRQEAGRRLASPAHLLVLTVFCSRHGRDDIFCHQELLEGVHASINLVLPPFPFSGETEAQWIEGLCSVFPGWSQDSLGEKGPDRYGLGSCLLLISLFSVTDVTDPFLLRMLVENHFWNWGELGVGHWPGFGAGWV